MMCKYCGIEFKYKRGKKYCSEKCKNWRNKGISQKYQWNNPLARETVAAAQEGLSYGKAQEKKMAEMVKITRKY